MKNILREKNFKNLVFSNPFFLPILTIFCWTFSGLIGHEPWKPDEAHIFGAAYGMTLQNNWLIPFLADTPFLERPILVFLIAAFFMQSFPFLDLHDAARLSTGLWILICFIFCQLASKELWGKKNSWIPPLFILSSFGILVRGHQLISEVIFLSSVAILVYALALANRRKLLSGILIGLSLSLAFYSQGFLLTLFLIFIIFFLPVVSPVYRTSNFLQTLITSVLLAILISLIWPSLLFVNSPEVFKIWFFDIEMSKIINFFQISFNENFFYYFLNFFWFAWPVWPFTFWSIWIFRNDILKKREIQMLLLVSISILLFLTLQGENNDSLFLSLLVPISLLATPTIEKIPRNSVNLFFSFTCIFFTTLLIILWLCFFTIRFSFQGFIFDFLSKIQPLFIYGSDFKIVFAILISISWIFFLINLTKNANKSILLWGIGLTLNWMVAVSLIFPWIDYGKSYKVIFSEIDANIKKNNLNICGMGLGISQKAMLHYYNNIVTKSYKDNMLCDYLIVQTQVLKNFSFPSNYELLWTGNRSGDTKELYYLLKAKEIH